MNMPDMRPEKLDAHYDLLDLTGADDPKVRLPLIAGVTYHRPRTIAEILREDFGPEDGGNAAILNPGPTAPVTHLSLSSAAQ